MKIAIAGFSDTVANEAMCLDTGTRLGIPSVRAAPRRFGGKECLLVERYDRAIADGKTTRLNQEDFCQALGIAPSRKYEKEGGPTVAASFDLVRRAASVPARDGVALLDQLILSFLVGNCDAHGKNYSLLYRPQRTELAPAYDVLSMRAYAGLDRKMAMKIGTEARPDYVRARHLGQMLGASGLGITAAKRRIVALARSAPDHASDARGALVMDGWGSAVLDRIVDTVSQRSRQLVDELT